MNRTLCLSAGVLLAAIGNAAHGAELILAAEGKTDYQIVLPDESPSPSVGESLVQTARLLQAAFQANGIAIPVVTESRRDPNKPGLYLGNTRFARAHGVDLDSLAGWGYVQRVVGRDVILAGRDHPAPGQALSDPRRPAWDRVATAKAVCDFLRQYVGTRFLYPDLPPRLAPKDAADVDWLRSPAVEFLKTPVISVPADLNVRQIPCLEYNTSYLPCGSFYDLANNRFPLVDTVFGVHTYGRAIPPEKYGDAHPEYFALIGGQRTRPERYIQYCVSNPQVQELLYQDMVRWLDMGYQVTDLGQPDGFQPCQCEQCRALFGTGDDWSEKLWILHRNLAERVLRSHPGKTVTLLVYTVTETPPKTFKTFPKNVRLMLCGTNEDDLERWRGYEIPGGFVSYVYNWCPNLGSRYTPMRTPRFVEAQAKRLFQHRIRGIYRDGPGILFGLEGPVYYVMGRMYDDPENNQANALLDEFCTAAFGRTAPLMRQFYDRLYHGIELYSEFLGTRAPAWAYRDLRGRGRKYLTDPFQLIGFLYTPSLLEALERDLGEAEKQAAAESEKVKARLALVRREFDYVKALARVVHLYHAYRIQPDRPSLNRLLDAIDARNALIESLFEQGRAKPVPGWTFATFPPPGHDASHLRLAYDGYQEPYKDTALNWDTKALREGPLP